MKCPRLKHGFYQENGGYRLYENGRELAWMSDEAYRHIKEHTNVASYRAALEWALKVVGHHVVQPSWADTTLHID